jgi:hypothetical protein
VTSGGGGACPNSSVPNEGLGMAGSSPERPSHERQLPAAVTASCRVALVTTRAGEQLEVVVAGDAGMACGGGWRYEGWPEVKHERR